MLLDAFDEAAAEEGAPLSLVEGLLLLLLGCFRGGMILCLIVLDVTTQKTLVNQARNGVPN